MSKITDHIGRKILRKRFNKINREKSTQNFEIAKTSAILFDLNMSDSFNVIKEFARFLESKKIKTTVIGYSSEKEPPENILLWPNFNIITKRNMNWFGKPKGEIAESFFQEQYDLLFILSKEIQLPGLFLQMLSLAKFKVGYYTEDENDLDLMISPVKNPDDKSYFIEQVKTYINMLNPSK